ncbi:MAG: hypothetical protein HPY67_01885 [Syntrophaceae bacterium]|nr:hypothetical protein [Syntrophaceae bacterium]
MVIDEQDELTEEEEDVTGADLTFTCPYCHKEADYSGGCPHFVFSFELVNFDYLVLNEDFKNRAIMQLRNQGYRLAQMPCPLEPWASDSEGNSMPSLDKLIPGLELAEYRYSGPHGHGSCGMVVGFWQISETKK